MCLDTIFVDENADEQYGQKLFSSRFVYDFFLGRFMLQYTQIHIN